MKFVKVCLDSRLIQRGEYFVPVVGDNFDGHNFVGDVMDKGAAGIIEVAELFDLAKERIKKVKPIIIGVAGSVGKSSLRSFLTKILETKYKVLEGDLNTKLGLASLIVNELNNQEVMVAELGIDRLGEMEEVMKFIEPDFSIVTKIEKEHLVFLKSLENVTRENSLAIKLSKTGRGYVNKLDKQKLCKHLKEQEMIVFPKTQVSKKVIMAIKNMKMVKHNEDYLVGVYQIVKDNFDFSNDEFIKSLNNIKKPKGRLNIIEGKNGSVIIDDSYNAVSDASVIKGIEYAIDLAQMQGKILTVLLSTMRETGDSEIEQHKNVAVYLNDLTDAKLILVSDEKGLYKKHLKISFEEAIDSEHINIEPRESDLFYVKGSQFYRMEKVVIKIMKDPKLAEKLLVRQDKRWE